MVERTSVFDMAPDGEVSPTFNTLSQSRFDNDHHEEANEKADQQCGDKFSPQRNTIEVQH